MSEVRLKGIASLEGIQLVFNNGAITSPFFCRDSDDEGASGSEPSTQPESFPYCYQLDMDREIKSITVTLERLIFITGIEFRYDNEGENVAFSHHFN